MRLQTAARRAYEARSGFAAGERGHGAVERHAGRRAEDFRRAIELDPSYAEGYHLIGDNLHDIDPERAVAFFRKSLALDARQQIIHADLADALGVLGRDEEAQGELKAMSQAGVGTAIVAGATALNDGRYQRYAEAVSTLTAIPTLRSAPAFWKSLVRMLRLGGRADDAMAEASALVAHFPQDCEGKTLLAALRLERRESAAAHALADQALALAQREAALPAEVRCGLHAGAALQDAGGDGGPARPGCGQRVDAARLRRSRERPIRDVVDRSADVVSVVPDCAAAGDRRRDGAPGRRVRARARRRAIGVEGVAVARRLSPAFRPPEGPRYNSFASLARSMFAPETIDADLTIADVDAFPDQGGGRCGAGTFGDEVLGGHQAANRVRQVSLADGHDAIDEPLDEAEGDRLGIRIAAKTVGESLAGNDLDQPAGAHALLEGVRRRRLRRR